MQRMTFWFFFYIFSEKIRFGMSYELWMGISCKSFIWNAKSYFFWKIIIKKKMYYGIPSQACLSVCLAGLGGSVGCAVRLETRRSRVQPPPRSATFFRGDWSWNIFYGHSLPSADSRRAVVSFWRKNVHNTGEPLRGLSLPSKRVVR